MSAPTLGRSRSLANMPTPVVTRGHAVHVRRLKRMWDQTWGVEIPIRLYGLIRHSFPGRLMPSEVLEELRITPRVLQTYWRVCVLTADCNSDVWNKEATLGCEYCLRATLYWAKEAARRWALLVLLLQETTTNLRNRHQILFQRLPRVPALCETDVLERHLVHLTFPAPSYSTPRPTSSGTTTA